MNTKKLINDLILQEEENENILHITAYENQLSKTAQRFLGSKLSERYYFGGGDKDGMIDFAPFTAFGLKSVENLLMEAEEACKVMLGASIVNLNLLSGVHAMIAATLASTEPGDTIMSVHHDDGGHFVTKGIVERAGRKHAFAVYDLKNLKFDAEKTAKRFREKKCKMLYLDVSYYITPINVAELRAAIGKDAVIIYDASHTVGLIMGNNFQSPFLEGADIICANTHKTLPGPQKALIAFKDEKLGKKVNNIISSCLYSSSHTNNLLALGITLLEMKRYGKDFSKQTVQNSNSLGKYLEEKGRRVRKTPDNNYSYTHQVHLYLNSDEPYRKIYKRLIANNISANFDNRMGQELFIRIGTQEITRRGMKDKEMSVVAELLLDAMSGKDVKKNVIDFNLKYKNIMYSFDSSHFYKANE